MRSWVCLVAWLAVAASLSPLAGANGCCPNYRIMGSGDAVLLPLVASCAAPASDYTPPDPCWLVEQQLGYDGLTAAAPVGLDQHLGHAFACAVTASATPGFESIAVLFDTDGDGQYDRIVPENEVHPVEERGLGADLDPAEEGDGGFDAPDAPTGLDPLDAALPDAVNPGFRDGSLVATLLGHPTPTVSGVVLAADAAILVTVGLDVTVDCTF